MLERIAAVLVVIGLSFACGYVYNGHIHKKEQERLEAAYKAAVEANEQTRQRYELAKDEAKEAYEKSLAQAKAAKPAIYRVYGGLRDNLSEVSQAPLYPTFGTSGPTTSDLAIAFSESVGEYLKVVGEAEEARARGLACEAQYNGLRK